MTSDCITSVNEADQNRQISDDRVNSSLVRFTY